VWFQAVAANANNNECLAHQFDSGGAACPSGTAASFIYNYEVKATGTLSSVWATTDATPAAGKSWVVNVRKNGTSVLSCTVSAGDTSCEGAGSVSVSAGDFLQVQLTTANGAANKKWKTYVVISN
jgi:hypothetical protein